MGKIPKEQDRRFSKKPSKSGFAWQFKGCLTVKQSTEILGWPAWPHQHQVPAEKISNDQSGRRLA